jgi:transposase-like protein
MEVITLTALSTFVTACLRKAGEKFSEKAVETAFESRKELAEKFTGLFKSDIIQLGLSDAATSDDIARQLATKPKIIDKGASKLQSDADSLKDLLATLRETAEGRVTINNFSNQTNNDKSVNIVGDNTNVTF